MARPVKCQQCMKMEPDRDKVIKSDKGKFFHVGECYDKHLKHQEFLESERKKLDELYEYIKKLHGIPDEQAQYVLKGVMWRIQELRNGNDVFKGKVEKKYKMGVEYDLLLGAYKLKEKDILWFIGQILDGSVTTKDVSACLSIALKGLSEAWRQREQKRKREEEKERLSSVSKKAINYHSEPTTYSSTKKKDDLDISDLL